MRNLPKHITIPNSNSYQVRITKNSIEYSLSFSWTEYESKKKALSAAVMWRDMKLKELGRSLVRNDLRTRVLSNKKTKLPVGITRYYRTDKRRQNRPQYMVFGVNYIKSDGHNTSKSFQVGNIENITKAQIKHAELTATAFRKEYENCFKNNKIFNTDKYLNWPEIILY